MRPDVAQRAGHARPRRIRAPRRLPVPARLERRREPALQVLQLDAADLPQPTLAHERPRVLDHRVAAVVVREREHPVPRVHEPAQRLGVRHRRRQRLVAHDVEPRLEEGARNIEVEMVRRDHDHEVEAVVRRARRFGGRHVGVAPVHAFRVESDLGALRRRPLRVRRERPRRDPGEPVQLGGHAVDVPDEGARPASDHAVPESARHPRPPSALRPMLTNPTPSLRSAPPGIRPPAGPGRRGVRR